MKILITIAVCVLFLTMVAFGYGVFKVDNIPVREMPRDTTGVRIAPDRYLEPLDVLLKLKEVQRLLQQLYVFRDQVVVAQARADSNFVQHGVSTTLLVTSYSDTMTIYLPVKYQDTLYSVSIVSQVVNQDSALAGGMYIPVVVVYSDSSFWVATLHTSIAKAHDISWMTVGIRKR